MIPSDAAVTEVIDAVQEKANREFAASRDLFAKRAANATIHDCAECGCSVNPAGQVIPASMPQRRPSL